MRTLLLLLALFISFPSVVVAESFEETRAKAKQGDAKAQTALGVMYAHGQGVSRDYAEASKWYRKAADQGYAQAQYNLGVMYATGQGVSQDYMQSYKWFDLAASRFPTGPDRDKAKMARDELAAEMTPEQIAEAQKLAREGKPTRSKP